jgi:hypothetical protein
MDHLERHTILGAVEAGVKRGCGNGGMAAWALMFFGKWAARVEKLFDIAPDHRG